MRPRWRLAAVVSVALLVGAVCIVAYRYDSVPDRVHACGRDYGHKDGAVGAAPLTLTELRRQEGDDVAKIKSVDGREVWAHATCGLGIFLRVDEDRFISYGLVGGP